MIQNVIFNHFLQHREDILVDSIFINLQKNV